MSERSFNLYKEWNKLKQKEIISLRDFEELSRLISNLNERIIEVEKSREEWKSKYLNLKKEEKENGKRKRT